jgi:hypothetical protein
VVGTLFGLREAPVAVGTHPLLVRRPKLVDFGPNAHFAHLSPLAPASADDEDVAGRYDLAQTGPDDVLPASGHLVFHGVAFVELLAEVLLEAVLVVEVVLELGRYHFLVYHQLAAEGLPELIVLAATLVQPERLRHADLLPLHALSDEADLAADVGLFLPFHHAQVDVDHRAVIHRDIDILVDDR